MTDPESVGSLGEEAVRLLRAFAASGVADAEGAVEGGASTHVCTTAWCPVCQVVGFVKEHPEAVEQVADSAIQMARSVKDLLEQALSPAPDSDRP